MNCFYAIAFLNCACSARVPSFRSQSVKSNLGSYTLEQFAQDFGRSYKQGSDEYKQRLSLFQASVDRITKINSKNALEGRMWVAGIHPFMDWTAAERKALNGYKPSHTHHLTRMTALQTHARIGSHGSGSARVHTNTTLADSFDSSATPAIRNQGNCGSCWAISAVEALEAQLLKDDQRVRLSAQSLVDCVPNPQHCGGTGGCDGATGELAYAFARDHGVPLEIDLEYTAVTGSCPISGQPKQPVLDEMWPAQKRVVVSGWNQLPSNKAAPMMQALVNEGPVVVAVDGNDWFDYSSGVFDGCEKDADLGHAVLLTGYGEDSGKKYWRIQNSWGPNWGEAGFIRITRHDNEDEWCGTDSKPQDGVGCDGGPPEITVCGMCGLLYDPIVPEGVRLDTSGSTTKEDAMLKAGDYTPWKPKDAGSSVGSDAEVKQAQTQVQKMQALFGTASKLESFA